MEILYICLFNADRTAFQKFVSKLEGQNCMVLNRPGQSFVKFGCPDNKREIMLKQAKVKSCSSR